MEDHELVAKLETAGFILGQPAIREGGVVLYRINDVFMFEEDAVDLANGNATIEQMFVRLIYEQRHIDVSSDCDGKTGR